MKTLNLIFPHQLFASHPFQENGSPFLLLEEFLFFRQYRFHRQKILFHRSSMKYYENYLLEKNKEVKYISAAEGISDIRQLIPQLAAQGVKEINYIDPVDDWLERRLISSAKKAGIRLHRFETPLFLNTEQELALYFSARKKFFQTDFYIHQRKTRGILLDEKGGPLGGKWTYDNENRLPYPKAKTAPRIPSLEKDLYFEEARDHTLSFYPENPGEIADRPLYPCSHAGAKNWFEDFLAERFMEFGPYEDAMVGEQGILHHSVISPLLNTGLLDIREVLNRTIELARENQVPLASLEGFIRQLLGWREFMRALYVLKGREIRRKNFWGLNNKIHPGFYDGQTGILPVDQVLKKLIRTGYCHHIERLMVLGNFLLLSRTGPEEVYRWFMEFFIDAYDWVMVPNIYSMSQFADGGLMATKPYISGSNYLRKMGDFSKGSWEQAWDGLFWKFLEDHRSFFSSNPRLGMLLKTLDKMDPARKNALWTAAAPYLPQHS